MSLSNEDNMGVAEYASTIRVVLDPARSAIESLVLLTKGHNLPGVADWVINTALAMSKEERNRNELVLIGLHYVAMPQGCWNSFPAYVNALAEAPSEALRDKMLDVYDQQLPAGEDGMDRQAALASAENYLEYLHQRFTPDHVDEVLERQAYQYVLDPPAMQNLVVNHLREMWGRYLAAEWERVRPELKKTVRAFQGLDLKGKTFREAAQLVTGQDLVSEKWNRLFAITRSLVFVPHPHVGSFVRNTVDLSGGVYIFFNAESSDDLLAGSPELSLTEIMIRISALADDTRLRILRQIAENGEQRSQEIIEALNISQSAASRHLAQLSATGYLTERRCAGGKCYALNPERLAGTLQAIANYLLVRERS